MGLCVRGNWEISMEKKKKKTAMTENLKCVAKACRIVGSMWRLELGKSRLLFLCALWDHGLMSVSIQPRDMHACLVTQSCPTFCDPMDCSPPGSFVHGDSPGKYTEVSCRALLQGIFPTQGSNLGLLHCRWFCYHLSLQGSPSYVMGIWYTSQDSSMNYNPD